MIAGVYCPSNLAITFAVMSFWRKMLYAAISGFLFSAAWPRDGFAPLIFIAFVPLLIISDDLKQQRASTLQITLFAYIAFLIWNALTTYWVYNSSPEGGIAAITLLSLFFATVYTTFQFIYKYTPKYWGLLALPIFWIAWEYFHLDWDLTWPWLTLGNVFSEYYSWVQWYEYTGVFGGSLWVFAINILLFLMIKEYHLRNLPNTIKAGATATVLLAVPVVLSAVRYSSYTEQENPVDVVVVQPNIDPYHEKFVEGTYISQTQKFINLAQTKLDNNVQYIVGPETAISAGIEEAEINQYEEVKQLRAMLKSYPQVVLVTGASTAKFYKRWETPPPTASLSQRGNFYYDSYNTAVQIDTSLNVQYSHKAKLVPGVERMPFSGKLGWLEKYAIDLGGANGTLGFDSIQHIFTNINNPKQIIAPSICYESVYGEYMGKFIQRGAGLIFIITNDGWWGNTPGHRQHASYARLRAIESRRSIARSANTGISCFVNQRGDMQQATEYWKPAVIRQKINANFELTFYTKHGDYIAHIFTWLLLPFLALAVFFRFRKK